MKKFYLLQCLCVLACSAMFSCQKDLSSASSPQVVSPDNVVNAQGRGKGEKLKREYGPAKKMGKGEVRSFFTVSANGVPQEIGIEMTQDALTRLPEDAEKGTYHLSLPPIAQKATPFNHIVIEWNAHGHAPFFYELPHFDFHFYTQTEKEISAIPSYASNPAGFDNNPLPGYLPASYIAPPGGEEAEMGKHWVDASSPELPWNGGATFTKTFIYGSYNGKVNFYEPMITMAYLQSCQSSSNAYPQPEKFEKRSNYPTTYNVYQDNDEKRQTYNVSLSNFVAR